MCKVLVRCSQPHTVWWWWMMLVILREIFFECCIWSSPPCIRIRELWDQVRWNKRSSWTLHPMKILLYLVFTRCFDLFFNEKTIYLHKATTEFEKNILTSNHVLKNVSYNGIMTLSLLEWIFKDSSHDAQFHFSVWIFHCSFHVQFHVVFSNRIVGFFFEKFTFSEKTS